MFVFSFRHNFIIVKKKFRIYKLKETYSIMCKIFRLHLIIYHLLKKEFEI